jgi:hypothetical protein
MIGYRLSWFREVILFVEMGQVCPEIRAIGRD